MRFLIKPRYSLWDLTAIAVGGVVAANNPDTVAIVLIMVFVAVFVGAAMRDMLGM